MFYCLFHVSCYVGGLILAADYSQLELRILAHLSRDRRLLKVLNSGADVFKSIAAEWKMVDPASVDDRLRQQAKQVVHSLPIGLLCCSKAVYSCVYSSNLSFMSPTVLGTVILFVFNQQICYGIIYGMGAKSLGEQMDIDENDAASYIESFKSRYSGKFGAICRLNILTESARCDVMYCSCFCLVF